jgi:ferredoxin, 2Fe-2S
MAKVKFIGAGGEEREVEAPIGASLMQTALDHMIPGILGDCGGCCSCATCHAHIDPKWFPLLEPASEDEKLMLAGGPDVRDNSRLTCQIRMTPELDGLVMFVPE